MARVPVLPAELLPLVAECFSVCCDGDIVCVATCRSAQSGLACREMAHRYCAFLLMSAIVSARRGRRLALDAPLRLLSLEQVKCARWDPAELRRAAAGRTARWRTGALLLAAMRSPPGAAESAVAALAVADAAALGAAAARLVRPEEFAAVGGAALKKSHFRSALLEFVAAGSAAAWLEAFAGAAPLSAWEALCLKRVQVYAPMGAFRYCIAPLQENRGLLLAAAGAACYYGTWGALVCGLAPAAGALALMAGAGWQERAKFAPLVAPALIGCSTAAMGLMALYFRQADVGRFCPLFLVHMPVVECYARVMTLLWNHC